MAEVIVELIEGYFVEIDSLNHTLKKRYIGKNKNTGEDKQSEKIIGYYKNLPDCIERLVRLIPIDENNNTAITLREYAEASERAFKRVEKLSEKLSIGNGGWIPVSERMPGHYECVLACCNDEFVTIASFNFQEKRWECLTNMSSDTHFPEGEEVIAWMPLPEPYKGE